MNAGSDGPKDGQNDMGDVGFEEMLEASFSPTKKIGLGDKVTATVLSIGQDYLFLDLGDRAEGLLMRGEVLGDDGEVRLAEGDPITVYVTAFRDGATLCGLRMGSGAEKPDNKQAVFDALKEAYDAGMPVEGNVKESIKGGFSVTVMGERAFCPISQIDDKYVETGDAYLGQTYAFEIIKLEENARNIVISRRKLLETENEEKAAELWKTMQPGDTFEGVVAGLKPYGAFVDIGGIQGLLHISEISYERIADPSEVLEAGQALTVSIKDMDPETRKISLSMKALLQDPWTDRAAGLKVNQVLNGKVIRIAEFGAFVALAPGIDGLLHISEMSTERRIQTPREVVSVDDEITVRIQSIDMDARRVSLTLNIDNAEGNWAEELAAGQGDQPSNGSMGTFADLLKNKTTK
jgi:small subunit ribosomal protein S1